MSVSAFHTRQALSEDLAALGIENGDGLFVHASLGAVGHVIGGARSVIEALIDAVGETGLIAMPGFSTDAHEPEFLLDCSMEDQKRIRDAVPGFDKRRSPTVAMGVIAETFRTWPGTFRSDHPTVSICARGGDAADYLSPHSLVWGTGPDTPLGAFRYRPDMKMLLIGVGWNRCSLLHTAETLASHRRTKVRRFKRVENGEGTWIETSDVVDDLGRFFPAAGAAFEAHGSVRSGRLGGAETRVCSYANLLEFATKWIGDAVADLPAHERSS